MPLRSEDSIRRAASSSRSSGTVSESRTKPSPLGPKDGPGETTTPACSSTSSVNEAESWPSGHAHPEVRRRLRRVDLEPDRGERLGEQVAPPLVDGRHLAREVARLGQRDRRRMLNGLEHAGVEVRLQLPVALDHLRVAGDEAGAPARHVPALREREDLDADLLRARRLEEARRAVAVEAELGVGVVVDDDQVVRARELDRALEVAGLDDGAGRVVRVVEEEQVRAREHVGRDRVELGQEALLGLAAAGSAPRRPRTAGPTCTADSPGPGERQTSPGSSSAMRDVADRLLAAERGHDLRGRVELDAEALAVEAGRGLAELVRAVVRRVLVRARVARGLGQRVDHGLRASAGRDRRSRG